VVRTKPGLRVLSSNERNTSIQHVRNSRSSANHPKVLPLIRHSPARYPTNQYGNLVNLEAENALANRPKGLTLSRRSPSRYPTNQRPYAKKTRRDNFTVYVDPPSPPKTPRQPPPVRTPSPCHPLGYTPVHLHERNLENEMAARRKLATLSKSARKIRQPSTPVPVTPYCDADIIRVPVKPLKKIQQPAYNLARPQVLQEEDFVLAGCCRADDVDSITTSSDNSDEFAPQPLNFDLLEPSSSNRTDPSYTGEHVIDLTKPGQPIYHHERLVGVRSTVDDTNATLNMKVSVLTNSPQLDFQPTEFYYNTPS